MLAHSTLANMLRMKFIMNVENDWSYDDIDGLKPWELEVHVMMLEKYLADKEAAAKNR